LSSGTDQPACTTRKQCAHICHNRDRGRW